MCSRTCGTDTETREIEAGIPDAQSQSGATQKGSAGNDQESSENATLIAAKISMALVVASIISGNVWAHFFQDSATPQVTLHSACALSQLGFNEGLGVAPWNFSSPQWIACIIFIGGLVLRKYLLPRLTDGLYSDLTDAKKEKVSNYMLEILGTTAALVLCSFLGLFELLFQPEKYSHPSPEQTYNLGLGGNILMCCFITTYSLELAFDKNMRIGLALHHWTTIGLALWALPAAYSLSGDTMTFRAFFALSLYMSTEQNVFIEMLMYHRRIYWPLMYYASAVYYALTRGIITVLNLWAWWEMYGSISKIQHKGGLVYSLWLVLLPANFLLNFTQLLTIQSLLGIARSVAKRVTKDHSRPKQPSERKPKKMSMTNIKSAMSTSFTRPCKDLGDTFRAIDSDGTGLTLESWRTHILGIDNELVLPKSAVNRIFDALDPDQKGFVTFTEFEKFFGPFVIQGVDFDLVLLASVLKSAIESGKYEPLEVALQYELTAAVSKIRRQLNEMDECMAGDCETLAALDKLQLKDRQHCKP
jgi:Ca2+-binding EF-hand superfamily protein